MNRTPPFSAEAERSVLGSCIHAAGECIAHCQQEEVTTSHFYVPAHRSLYDSLIEMTDARGSDRIDLLTLADYLKFKGRLETIGGEAFLHRLVDLPTSLHLNHYISILKRDHVKRSLIAQSQQINELCYNSDEQEGNELLAKAQGMLFDINTGRSTQSKAFVTERIVQRYQDAHAGSLVGIPSPWPSFDSATAGPRKGHAVVLASKQGTGKSTLVANWIRHLGLLPEAIPCAVFPFEDGNDITWGRIAASHGQYSTWELDTGRAKEEVISEASTCLDLVTKLPIFIEGRRGMDISAIRAAVARGVSKHGWQFVVLDGFKDIARRERIDPNSEDARISAGICDMAEQFDVSVMVVHHIKKIGNRRDGDSFTMEDIRGSGRICDDARMVIVLQSDFRLEALKNNYGPTGNVQLEFLPNIGVFQEKSRMATFDNESD